MVANFHEQVTKFWNSWCDTARMSFDQGREWQQAWLESCSRGGAGTIDFKELTSRHEQARKGAASLFEKNARAVASLAQAAVETNADLFKGGGATNMFDGKADVAKCTDECTGKVFDATEATMERFGKAGREVVDNWIEFFGDEAPRPSRKENTKKNK